MFKSARIGREPVVNLPVEAAAEQVARQELLQQISKFLLDHQLEVNQANLTLAQELCCGRNPGLSRRINARQLANEPVTQAWLDDAVAAERGAGSGSTGFKLDRVRPPLPEPGMIQPVLPDDHHALAARLAAEIDAACTAGHPSSIAFCDVDQFQAISESHGRDTGVRVIQAITRVLQRVSGENCHLVGNGGEKFVLLFCGLTPDQAGKELDIARQTFAQRKLIDRKTRIAIGNVTFSGGVADVRAYDQLRAALAAADAALAEARGQGRNRIVVAGRADPISPALPD